MTDTKKTGKNPVKNDRPLAIDIPFDDALERFIQTDPKELDVTDDDDDEIPVGSEIELPKATHQGQMAVGKVMLDCYVL